MEDLLEDKMTWLHSESIPNTDLYGIVEKGFIQHVITQSENRVLNDEELYPLVEVILKFYEKAGAIEIKNVDIIHNISHTLKNSSK